MLRQAKKPSFPRPYKKSLMQDGRTIAAGGMRVTGNVPRGQVFTC